jgi:parvulin-like peptidyl-prolyl cis-trans isomerase-like protein
MTTMIQFLIMWFVVAAVPQSTTASRVIASTKEWKITAGDFQEILASFPPDSRERFSVAANRRNLLDEVIRIWVLSTEARKNGMAVGTTYAERRNHYVLYAQYLAGRITEEQLRTYYSQHVGEYERVRLSHILILNGSSPVIPPNVDTKRPRLPYDEALKKAREVRAKLQQGGKFEELAKMYSDDPTSGPLGGEIGLVARGQMQKELETAAFNLKVGEFSEVVGSVYGFHILRITEKKVLSFEELKDQIRQKLMADAVNADIDPKVKAAGVTIDEAYFR